MRILFVATLALAACATTSSAPKQLSFIENDYAHALREARQKKLPIFADAWAPWCHTCRYMQAYVFPDPALGKHGKRYVWLSVDTEQDKNAAFVERYAIGTLPTLMVIDPTSERAVLTRASSATVVELETLFDDGERLLRGDAAEVDKLLRQAAELHGSGRADEAARVYRKVLELVPSFDSALRAPLRMSGRRARVVESLIQALQSAGDEEGCATAAAAEAPAMARVAPFASIVGTGISCAVTAAGDGAWRAVAIGTLEPLAREALAQPQLADDKSIVYEGLVGARDFAGDKAGGRALAVEWLAFLEAEADKAPSPSARAVFDPHRVGAALRIGDPARALPALIASERAMPDDYNPPARQAILYRELGRLHDARDAVERALKKVYGPRRLRLDELRADIYRRLGDVPAARRALEEGMTVAASLPQSRRTARMTAKLKKQLEALPPAK